MVFHMALIRFATPRPSGGRMILLDEQYRLARLDRPAVLAPSHDLVERHQRMIEQLQSLIATGGGGGGSGGGTGAAAAPDPFDVLRMQALRGEGLEPLIDAMMEPGVASAVTQLSSAGRLGGLIVHARRLRGVSELDDVAIAHDSTVEQLRDVVRHQAWMFGGRYRSLPAAVTSGTAGVSIPVLLTRTDGAFHVVEAALANVPDLIVPSGERFVVGTAVQEAVGRAITQLELLDEHAEELQQEELFAHMATRRALATVVLGHKTFVPVDLQDHIRPTLRTYSSHLAGIEVITYDELSDAARRVTASDSIVD